MEVKENEQDHSSEIEKETRLYNEQNAYVLSTTQLAIATGYWEGTGHWPGVRMVVIEHGGIA